MIKNNTNQKDGFTIIEVVLVLAIAGLIMLMVFIALPALQRSQRDTQRRQDLSRIVTAIENYRSMHSGRAPTIEKNEPDSPNTFIENNLKSNGDSFVDPSGDDYYFADVTNCTSNSDCKVKGDNEFISGAIYVYQNATCTSETNENGKDKVIEYKNGKGNYAFTMKLESSEGIICVNS